MVDSILNKDNTPFDKYLKLIVKILEDYSIIQFKNSKNIDIFAIFMKISLLNIDSLKIIKSSDFKGFVKKLAI